MKFAKFFVLSMLAGLVPSASAQTDFASCVVRPFDPVCQVMGPVYRQRAEIEARSRVENEVARWRNAADLYGVRDYAGRAIAPAIIGATAGYGRSVSGGPSRKKAGIASGLVTGGLTYAVTRDWRGAAVAAGTSGLMSAAFAGNRGRDDNKQLDCGKQKLSRREEGACWVIATEQAAAERQAQAEAERRAKEVERRTELERRRHRGGYLRNATRYPLEVTDCEPVVVATGGAFIEVEVLRFRPGQRYYVVEAKCGFDGTMLVPSPDTAGTREDREAAFIVSDNAGGWVFHAPAVGKKGGR